MEGEMEGGGETWKEGERREAGRQGGRDGGRRGAAAGAFSPSLDRTETRGGAGGWPCQAGRRLGSRPEEEYPGGLGFWADSDSEDEPKGCAREDALATRTLG